MKQLADYIRSIPDFPKEGILFRDITTLIENKDGFRLAVDGLAAVAKKLGRIDKIASPEARGFVFGAPVAVEIGAGLVMMRKPGKLPCATVSVSYELEYGTDELHIHRDSIQPGDRVLIIDDLLATGGTMAGAKRLIEEQGGEVVGLAFVVELIDLMGREKFGSAPVFSLMEFPGH